MARVYQGLPATQIQLRRAHGEIDGKPSDTDDRYVEEEDDSLWGQPTISSTTLKLAKYVRDEPSDGPEYEDLQVCGLGLFLSLIHI